MPGAVYSELQINKNLGLEIPAMSSTISVYVLRAMSRNSLMLGLTA